MAVMGGWLGQFVAHSPASRILCAFLGAFFQRKKAPALPPGLGTPVHWEKSGE
jgi:hypothetical protein